MLGPKAGEYMRIIIIMVRGVDIFIAFAPVVKIVTVCLLQTLTFTFNMHVHRLDMSNAFCYARIEGDVSELSTCVTTMSVSYHI